MEKGGPEEMNGFDEEGLHITRVRIGAISLCIFVIVFQILRLLTWYLPYPHDIRLMLVLFEEPWLSLINFSSILSIVLAIVAVVYLLKYWKKQEIEK